MQLFQELEVYYLDLMDANYGAFGKNHSMWCDPVGLVALADRLGYAEGTDQWATGAEEDDDELPPVPTLPVAKPPLFPPAPKFPEAKKQAVLKGPAVNKGPASGQRSPATSSNRSTR